MSLIKEEHKTTGAKERIEPLNSQLELKTNISSDTKIFIVEDHQMMAAGLKTLIREETFAEVIGQASDGREALELIDELRPNIVLMDIALPNLNGIEATRQIVENHPHTSVIGLSMHSEQRFVLELLRAGAKGYILKDSAFGELVEAIEAINSGKIYLSPSIANIVVDKCMSKMENPSNTAFAILTDREREVLQLLAEGKTTKRAALDLGISPKTVETHRSNIMEKTNIDNLADLTKYAVREGLTTIEL